MSNTDIDLQDTQTEAAVVANIARRAAGPAEITIVEDQLLGIIVNGELHQIDISLYQETPGRQSGTVSFTDRDSFGQYINRHKDDSATTVWSDVDAGTMTAVLNDHEEGIDVSGWGDHRAVLRLKLTDEWRFWAGQDGKLLPQVEFAHHLEDGALNIVNPAAADMMEIALKFQAKSGVDFKASYRPESGEVGFRYEEKIETGTRAGTMEIPAEFTLRLQPFEGGPEYADIQARFRYRITQGGLFLGYKIVRPDQIKRTAFNDITAGVSEAVGLDVYAGAPRSS